MDAHKAVELGFADGILQRQDTAEEEDLESPEASMLYSRAAVTNSLMERIAAKCRIKVSGDDIGKAGASGGGEAGSTAKGTAGEAGAVKITENSVDNGRSADEIRERLNFIKRFI